jgi:hypothetical protein
LISLWNVLGLAGKIVVTGCVSTESTVCPLTVVDRPSETA